MKKIKYGKIIYVIINIFLLIFSLSLFNYEKEKNIEVDSVLINKEVVFNEHFNLTGLDSGYYFIINDDTFRTGSGFFIYSDEDKNVEIYYNRNIALLDMESDYSIQNVFTKVKENRNSITIFENENYLVTSLKIESRFTSSYMIYSNDGVKVTNSNYRFDNLISYHDLVTEKINLFYHFPVILGIVILSLVFISLIFTFLNYYLNNKKNKNINFINLIDKIFDYILLGITLLALIEILVLGFTRSFIRAKNSLTIPDKSQFIDSVCYILIHNGDDFLNGILVTLEISLIGTIIGFILGLLLVLLRILKVKKEDSELIGFLKKIGLWFSKLYVTIFRGTPMMVQAVLFYYLLPFALSVQFNIPSDQINRIFTAFIAGLLTVSLNTTAYLTEVLRGGIEAVDKGQLEASRSLGMGYWKSMMKIVFPQAIKNSLPAICNEFIINIKDTSVLNVITVVDIYYVTKDVQSTFSRFNEPFFIAAVIYLMLTVSMSFIINKIEKRMNIEPKALTSSN